MIIDTVPQDQFTEAFGDAFKAFLRTRGLSVREAAAKMGVDHATLNTYLGGVKGTRRRPTAEVLAQACGLLGFQFEYGDYIIAALKDGTPLRVDEKELHLQFTREIDLAQNGAVLTGLRKPPGRIELSVTLKAVS